MKMSLMWLSMTAAVVATPLAAEVVVKRTLAPLITPQMLPGQDGANINGPSLVRLPDWVTDRLGRYYLYFAHHNGTYIRMAYADRIEGPWRVHPGGVLRIEQAAACRGHVASPDVIVDETARQLRLYFHCPIGGSGPEQKTFLALSANGLKFSAGGTPLGDAYFRVFRRRDAWYALAWGGRLFRSADGLQPFTPGPSPFVEAPRGALSDSPGPRHVAVQVRADHAWVYYSSIGDEPERILRRRLDTTGDWTTWRAGPPEEILRPATAFEGADLPVVRSRVGGVELREHALRDPFIHEEDGRTYLLYSVAGESGIALAEIAEGAKEGHR
jgi:hypothetical protein